MEKVSFARSANDAETDLVKRTDEALTQTRAVNDELIEQINALKAKKAEIQDKNHQLQNEMDLRQVAVHENEKQERLLKEEILQLTYHS